MESGTVSLPDHFFCKDTKALLAEMFLRSLHTAVGGAAKFAKESGRKTWLTGKSVNVSTPELAQAIKEADMDLRFLAVRRGFSHEKLHDTGLARAKIAGTLAFRLLRGRIVHIIGNEKGVVDDTYAGRLQTLAVFELAYKWIMKIDPCSFPFVESRTGRPWLLYELIFLVERRHYNQESLALIFDAADKARQTVIHVD